ncbi:hypothetical protein DIPPA_26031 [Diplonema papillatum]|nr:hypothetical protein DIPPA_26031 [Diplonema papillatum]
MHAARRISTEASLAVLGLALVRRQTDLRMALRILGGMNLSWIQPIDRLSARDGPPQVDRGSHLRHQPGMPPRMLCYSVFSPGEQWQGALQPNK